MKSEEIVKEIIDLLSTCKKVEVADNDLSLFANSLAYTAADVTYVLVKLNQSHPFSMEKLIRRIKCFSVNELADNIAYLSNAEAEL